MIRQTYAVGMLTLASLLISPLSVAGSTGSEAHSCAEMADRFSLALKASDEAAVRTLLDPEVLIFESGNVESSLEEYASHHMGADMAFMAHMDKEIISRQVFADGEIAVVSSRYRMHGSYNGNNIDQVSSETLVFRKAAGAWKIIHIHWS